MNIFLKTTFVRDFSIKWCFKPWKIRFFDNIKITQKCKNVKIFDKKWKNLIIFDTFGGYFLILVDKSA